MITEKRMKELEEKFWNSTRITLLPDAKEIRQLIRTVAAEAREAGIDELCNSLSDRLRRGPQAGVALIVEDEAERLKEKGK